MEDVFPNWKRNTYSSCGSRWEDWRSGQAAKQFCLRLRLRTLADEIIERNRVELEQELETFLEQLKHGIHEGGGLLGRAAEFLIGQRGL